MRYLAALKIIIVTAIFAGPLIADEGIGAKTGASADSVAATAVDASIDTISEASSGSRSAAYNVRHSDPAAKMSPTALTEADIFRADASGPSEIMRYRGLTTVSIPFTLSSVLNRVLPYGNVYPAYRNFLTTDFTPYLLPYGANRYWRGDMISPAQASGFSVDPFHGFLYEPYPNAITKPEFMIFWENGVFSQNILNMRLTRPLSRSMTLNLFSNYRYFEGRQFSHQQSDVASFYEFFYSDTSRMANEGYNPLVDEHVLGGTILWTGADSAKVYASFVYAGLINDYALNIPAPSLALQSWGEIDRGVYKVDAAMTGKKFGVSSLDVKASFISEDIAITSMPTVHDTMARDSGQVYNFIADAKFTLPSGVGFAAGSAFKSVTLFSGEELFLQDYYAKAFYSRKLRRLSALLGGNTAVHVDGRMTGTHYSYDSAFHFTGLTTGASIECVSKKNDGTRLSLYFDGLASTTVGAEGQAQWEYAGLLLGYQMTPRYSSDFAWLENTPPYQQPGHTFIIAPWTKRIGGFALMSKSFITDTKPHIKTTASLSHTFLPGGMTHTFETELGFDYWSERDPVVFAGHYGWDDPIFDLNLKITAHIKSFRLFYKIDNLLNMRNAYVPGYFSPGLTFRWGLNWFI